MSDPPEAIGSMAVDIDALSAHAASLRATSDRISRIQQDLSEIGQAIRADPVNSGFGAFPAATDAYTRFAAVVDAMYAALGEAVADVQKAVDANGAIADKFRAAEKANASLFQASGPSA